MLSVLAIIGCVCFGVARLVMPTVSEIHREDIFKDMAHLFVGWLFGAAMLAVGYRRSNPWDSDFSQDSKLYWFLALAMTVLEVVAFKLHQP